MFCDVQRAIAITIGGHPLSKARDLLDKQVKIGVVSRAQHPSFRSRHPARNFCPPLAQLFVEHKRMDPPPIDRHRTAVTGTVGSQHQIQVLHAQRAGLDNIARHHHCGRVSPFDRLVEVMVGAGIGGRRHIVLIDRAVWLVAGQPDFARMGLGKGCHSCQRGGRRIVGAFFVWLVEANHPQLLHARGTVRCIRQIIDKIAGVQRAERQRIQSHPRMVVDPKTAEGLCRPVAGGPCWQPQQRQKQQGCKGPPRNQGQTKTRCQHVRLLLSNNHRQQGTGDERILPQPAHRSASLLWRKGNCRAALNAAAQAGTTRSNSPTPPNVQSAMPDPRTPQGSPDRPPPKTGRRQGQDLPKAAPRQPL